MSTRWVAYAACRGEDVELFFPESYVTTAGQYQVEEAKAVCAGCFVRPECLDRALTAEDGKGAAYRFGIHGGYTPEERYELATGRRARPARNRAKAAA